ncbi:MAG: tRNA (adenosine(37)-N6)-threonylcarbamoyltransferase complex ATPase subunit type 1 TsaE [Pseudomonadota bacterium]
MSAPTKTLILKTEADTGRFASRMAKVLRAGDTVLLEGHIGAGKSAFARALIWNWAGTEIEVPSPTFTLVQTYDLPKAEVWHCDLYRLTHPDDLFELGIEDAFENAVCLIEWPDRLGDAAPPDALTLHFEATESHHQVTFSAEGRWADRLGDNDV